MSRICIQATWDDVPHLRPEVKAALLEGIPAHLRDARTKGIPQMGAGMIYPIDEAALVTDDFVIPTHWPKAYGLDVGWNKTACVWGAWDRQSDTVYIWSEYYQGQMPPSVHASAIRARGDWISGAIDPASAGSSQKDGSRLIDEYRNEGLSIYEADNAVEAGLFAVYQRMARGGLKIFKSCRNVLSELRIYRRDEKGKVVKENDHLMDALRYLTMTGMIYASVAPQQREEWSRPMVDLGRNAETGY